eukprot:XP_001692698.1 predicted protein [Chlamydomonas reinhardtii]
MPVAPQRRRRSSWAEGTGGVFGPGGADIAGQHDAGGLEALSREALYAQFVAIRDAVLHRRANSVSTSAGAGVTAAAPGSRAAPGSLPSDPASGGGEPSSTAPEELGCGEDEGGARVYADTVDGEAPAMGLAEAALEAEEYGGDDPRDPRDQRVVFDLQAYMRSPTPSAGGALRPFSPFQGAVAYASGALSPSAAASPGQHNALLFSLQPSGVQILAEGGASGQQGSGEQQPELLVKGEKAEVAAAPEAHMLVVQEELLAPECDADTGSRRATTEDTAPQSGEAACAAADPAHPPQLNRRQVPSYLARSVSQSVSQSGGSAASCANPAAARVRALVQAAQHGNVARVAYLVVSGWAAGGGAGGGGAGGRTALHYAAEAGSFGVVAALIEHGAFVGVRDGAGRTAYDLARRRGHDAVAQLLKDAADRRRDVATQRTHSLTCSASSPPHPHPHPRACVVNPGPYRSYAL